MSASVEAGKTDATRRDFLYVSTGVAAVVGVGSSLWPFVGSLAPSADILAFSKIEVDLSPIPVGQRVTVSWRGQPIFIDHRSAEQIALAHADDAADLIDPELDSDRVIKDEWLIQIGICTHLGCVPLGQTNSAPRGNWGGWFCPCHGSQYDTSGRVRKGPAPKNLVIPPYKFVENQSIMIG